MSENKVRESWTEKIFSTHANNPELFASFLRQQILNDSITSIRNLKKDIINNNNVIEVNIVKTLIELYKLYLSEAQKLSSNDIKKLQSKIWAKQDGDFWPNTFSKMLWKLPEQFRKQIIAHLDNKLENKAPKLIEIINWFDSNNAVELNIINPKAKTTETQKADLNNKSVSKKIYSKFKEESVSISSNDIKKLQSMIWAIQDWIFGPNSFRKMMDSLSEKNKELFAKFWNDRNIQSLPKFSEVIKWFTNPQNIVPVEVDKPKITTNVVNSNQKQFFDWLLEWEEDFNEKYWKMIEILWENLWLPPNFIRSIIKQETKFWIDLEHPGWSRGLMQLTNSPFLDMLWYYKKQKGINADREDTYKELFAKIDIEKIKTEVGKEQLTTKIWEMLKNLPKMDKKNYYSTIEYFQSILKDKNWKYYHVLNMIIWSVYLSYLYNKYEWKKWNIDEKVRFAATNYNWNKRFKIRYWYRVKKFFQQYNKK